LFDLQRQMLDEPVPHVDDIALEHLRAGLAG
jgi:hypothetical protein